MLTDVSEDLETQIARFSDGGGKIRKEQLKAMKARVDESLDSFKEHYQIIVDSSTAGMTDLIIARNGDIFIEAEGAMKALGTLKMAVLDQVARLKEEDGLILSDRIWRLTEEAKLDIASRLQKGILLGESHTKIAKDIRGYIKTSGGLRYKSERLALTEMAKAYKIANEMAVEQMRQNSRFMWFEKWELSPSHPRPDVCDILASQDEGEGPGVYRNAPNRHPGCMCYIYPVYREKRSTQNYPTISKQPIQTKDLPNSQHKLAKELTR